MTNKPSFETGWAARFESLIDTPVEKPADEKQEKTVEKPPEAETEKQAVEAIETIEAVDVVDAGGAGDATALTSLLGEVDELLTPDQMAEADKMTIADGTPGIKLMEAAGLAVSEAVRSRLPGGGRVGIMTGPGNNGGDGFIVARLLAEAGYDTTVWMADSREKLKGDAAFAAASWTGSAKGLSPSITDGSDIIVDAIFGAGLSKDIVGMTARTVEAINNSNIPVIAVDLPSGINGATGAVQGAAIRADETVTFFRKKPGHLLYPGRAHAGRVSVADIGISASCLSTIKPAARVNTPAMWNLPGLVPDGHKFQRGHAVVVAGKRANTGAARLAARGALRAGAGLVTLAAPAESVAVIAGQVTAIMLQLADDADALTRLLADQRLNTVIMGPGLGVGERTRGLVDAALATNASLVLDADALTSFAEDRETLTAKIKVRPSPVILTPHDGEFGRLFPDIDSALSKLERARKAAEQAGAVVVLKGPDSVVASPGGAAVINDNAPPQLATAGSGDVLAGIIGGLRAQGMAAFEAAAAGVWLHGAAGQTRGRGLIAEDLAEALPDVFTVLEGA